MTTAETGPVKKSALIPALAWLIGAVSVILSSLIAYLVVQWALRSRPVNTSLVASGLGLVTALVMIPAAAAVGVVISRRLALRIQQAGTQPPLFPRIWMGLLLTLLVTLACQLVAIVAPYLVDRARFDLDAGFAMQTIVQGMLVSAALVLVGAVPAVVWAAIHYSKNPPATGQLSHR